MLLEEPELSLHASVVALLPRVLAGSQRGSGAQVMLTTHSPDLLEDEGVRPEEVLVLTPTPDGTTGQHVADNAEAMELYDNGMTIAEIVRPRSEPAGIERLATVASATR